MWEGSLPGEGYGLRPWVNPRIRTSPGVPAKIDAIVRYILLAVIFDAIIYALKYDLEESFDKESWKLVNISLKVSI